MNAIEVSIGLVLLVLTFFGGRRYERQHRLNWQVVALQWRSIAHDLEGDVVKLRSETAKLLEIGERQQTVNDRTLRQLNLAMALLEHQENRTQVERLQ